MELQEKVQNNLNIQKMFGKDLKPFRSRKAFYRKRIPESSHARKRTVDILITTRNGDRKTMQSIRITSRPNTKKRKWNQFRQFS